MTVHSTENSLNYFPESSGVWCQDDQLVTHYSATLNWTVLSRMWKMSSRSQRQVSDMLETDKLQTDRCVLTGNCLSSGLGAEPQTVQTDFHLHLSSAVEMTSRGSVPHTLRPTNSKTHTHLLPWRCTPERTTTTTGAFQAGKVEQEIWGCRTDPVTWVMWLDNADDAVMFCFSFHDIKDYKAETLFPCDKIEPGWWRWLLSMQYECSPYI